MDQTVFFDKETNNIVIHDIENLVPSVKHSGDGSGDCGIMVLGFFFGKKSWTFWLVMLEGRR